MSLINLRSQRYSSTSKARKSRLIIWLAKKRMKILSSVKCIDKVEKNYNLNDIIIIYINMVKNFPDAINAGISTGVHPSYASYKCVKTYISSPGKILKSVNQASTVAYQTIHEEEDFQALKESFLIPGPPFLPVDKSPLTGKTSLIW